MQSSPMVKFSTIKPSFRISPQKDSSPKIKPQNTQITDFKPGSQKKFNDRQPTRKMSTLQVKEPLTQINKATVQTGNMGLSAADRRLSTVSVGEI